MPTHASRLSLHLATPVCLLLFCGLAAPACKKRQPDRLPPSSELTAIEQCAAMAWEMSSIDPTDETRQERIQRALVPALARACEQNHAGLCLQLGLQHQYGHGVPEDPTKAAPLLAKAAALLTPRCEARHGTACEGLGFLWQMGLGVTADQTKAARYYRLARQHHRAACDRGDGRACIDLGRLWNAGDGGPKDPARLKALVAQALPLLMRACQAGDGPACGRLHAFTTAKTATAEQARLRRRAVELFGQICARAGVHVPRR